MTTVQMPQSFDSEGRTLAAILHIPDNFDEARRHAAIAIATPGSSVKEQIGANYARRLAARGFLALTFDPSFQGGSGGLPRNLESPAARVEDIRCAADHLTTLPFVDEDRLGLLGICAGGSYAVSAALTDYRFRALGTVVASNIGAALRRMLGAQGVSETLEAVGRQRTAETRRAAARHDPWIPDSLAEAEAAGITDPDLLAAVWFYRESEYRHENAPNRLLFRSFGHLLSFDAFHLVPDLMRQPLQVIIGGRRGSTGQFEDGHRLFDLAPNSDKEIFVIEGAGHYDLYHHADYLDQAIDRLVPFYSNHLRAGEG